jgi:hypothetical protein
MQIETIFVPAELALHLIREKVRYKKVIFFYEPSRHSQALVSVHACSGAAGALVKMTVEVQRLC